MLLLSRLLIYAISLRCSGVDIVVVWYPGTCGDSCGSKNRVWTRDSAFFTVHARINSCLHLLANDRCLRLWQLPTTVPSSPPLCVILKVYFTCIRCTRSYVCLHTSPCSCQLDNGGCAKDVFMLTLWAVLDLKNCWATAVSLKLKRNAHRLINQSYYYKALE